MGNLQCIIEDLFWLGLLEGVLLVEEYLDMQVCKPHERRCVGIHS